MSALPATLEGRPVARHCPQLLRAGPEPASLLPRLARVIERLGRNLPAALAPLAGGGTPRAEGIPPREAVASELGMVIAPPAANALYRIGSGEHQLMLSIPAEALYRMVDRAFGGRGECPAELPETLPLAIDLMAGRVERLFADQLGVALAEVLGHPAAPLAALRRASTLDELEGFTADTPLALAGLNVAEPGGASWDCTLAVPIAALPALLGEATGNPAETAPRPRAMASATAAPFADLPLPLSAVLVDMAVPFARVARLRAGEVLPVAVARTVPIRVGDTVIAQGSVGSADDRVAIRITRAFQD
ncbi:MAG: FliM/FliN family flagellar motor switch protein [Proteobacteria bacterium]|nr:FliM/FliN family flagellar motor switch protein [Pseudomonadota bacterium]